MDQIKPIAIPTPSFGELGTASQGSGGTPATGFMDTLQHAISKANDIQLQASQATDALMTGQSQNVHGTMVALQEADISFQLMMQIRNKLVSAYEEIQRMQM
ncbi:MAG: flagellar hook-basal body complex protein FliE [Nitrospirae bacterium]|nr:flagellar hook-basal body complex protein FliE [Nitrospirota bacterium]MDO8357343.1 flagellar hook-basal body complex protein FliE [Nitrospirota bacterium]